MIEKQYYIYQLIDPITNLPFYIGKGCNNRMYDHEKEVIKGNLSNGNIDLKQKIKSILDENLKVQYKQVYFTNNNDEAYEKETELIKKIGLENLCNRIEIAWPIEKTEEIRRKLSKSLKGKLLSEEHKNRIRESKRNISKEIKQKMSNARKGIHLSEETKRKISIANTGKHHSEETKRKISMKNKNKSYEEIYGSKERAEEQKRKLSKAHKNHVSSIKGKKGIYKHTEESKQKMSKSHTGHITAEETRRKMSESRKGIIFSEEHKENLSKAMKGHIPWNKGKHYLKLKNKLLKTQ